MTQLSFDDNKSINVQYGILIIYSKCADIQVNFYIHWKHIGSSDMAKQTLIRT